MLMKSKNGHNILSVFKKHSYLSYCLFGTLFSVLVLSLVLTANYQRQVDTLRSEVERFSYDLLGYIEYDEDSKFHVPEDNKSYYVPFISRFNDYRDELGFAYVWDLQAEQVIWLHDSQFKHPHLTKIVEQHQLAVQREGLSGKGYNPAEAKTLNVILDDKTINSYMASAQKFSFRDKNNQGEHYVFGVIKSMRVIEDDLQEMIWISGIILVFINILMAGLWLVYHYSTQSRSATSNKRLDKSVAHNKLSHG